MSAIASVKRNFPRMCRACGRQFKASESGDKFCLDCYVKDAAMSNYGMVTVDLLPRIRRDLDRLVELGAWGSTAEEVAEYLVMRGVHDLIAAKVLPLEEPETTDGE